MPPETSGGGACAVQSLSSAELCRRLSESAEQPCQNNYALMPQNDQACRDTGCWLCSLLLRRSRSLL
jgi:hypothetical protein